MLVYGLEGSITEAKEIKAQTLKELSANKSLWDALYWSGSKEGPCQHHPKTKEDLGIWPEWLKRKHSFGGEPLRAVTAHMLKRAIVLFNLGCKRDKRGKEVKVQGYSIHIPLVKDRPCGQQ